MFNRIVAALPSPAIFSSDHDPLFEFHRWPANLRVLGVDEVKSVPYAPVSHPFIERLIGTIPRVFLDLVFFWGVLDPERKLGEFQRYFNDARVHASLGDVPNRSWVSRRAHQRGSMIFAGKRIVAASWRCPSPRDQQFETHTLVTGGACSPTCCPMDGFPQSL